MDLAAEFDIPPTASQVIEWESGGEEEDTEVEEEVFCQEEDCSPIFRRQQPVLSPVLRSRRRLADVVFNQKTRVLPTKRKLEMEEAGREIFLRRENSSFLQPSPAADTAPNPSLSSWLARLSPSSSPSPSSCQVSSCDSLAGLAPQPPAEGPAGLTGTAWLAGVEEKELDILGDILDSDSEGADDQEEFVRTSDKKRKPVKNGLVTQLERSLKWEKSRRALAKYQVDQGKEMDDDEKKVLVVKVGQERDVFIVDVNKGTLVINKEFCVREPAVGDILTFSPPRVSTMVEGREVWLGVTYFTVEAGGAREEHQQELQHEDSIQIQSLLCPCQSSTPVECLRNVLLDSCPSSSISPMTGMNIISCVSTSPSSTPGKISTIRQVVERVGGCSSSPQQVPYPYLKSRQEKQMLELVVHRVFTRQRRTGVNMTLDTTVGEEEIGISLLCEDQAGDFSVFKLDSELRKEESWSLLFGLNWEVVVGSKVIITSPLHVQDRITRSNNHKLFSVIRSIRKTDQRFCYVMKAFPGSKLQLAEVGVVEMECLPCLARATRAQGCRVNLRVLLLYIDRDMGLLFMQDNPPTGQTYWKAIISPTFPLSVQLAISLPVTAVVTSLSVDCHGDLLLDNYSAIMAVTFTSLDFSTLPAFSSNCKRGDLVRVEGVILRVDQDASLQWVECSTCQSDQLVATEQGWNCPQCGPVSGTSTLHKVELVCCVKGVWARLRGSASKVLPGSEGRGSFHPGEVIGQVLPGVMCRVGEDMVAVECDSAS